jgi:MFS family permease
VEQLGFTAAMFGRLNSSYSIAAVVTLLFGGYLVDRLGIRKSLFLFSALCLVGAILTALRGNFYTMAAGRAVLGFGAESQIVAVINHRERLAGPCLAVNLFVARWCGILSGTKLPVAGHGTSADVLPGRAGRSGPANL